MKDPSAAFYAHLGPFSALVPAAKAVRSLFGQAPVRGADTRRRAKERLRFTVTDERPQDLQVGRVWTADGVRGEEVSWSVGFGPRTEEFVLMPTESAGRLPGIVALHDHGRFKFFGKEKIADGPDGYPASLAGFRQIYYGGRAYANLLARSGFVVLVHERASLGKPQVPGGDYAGSRAGRSRKRPVRRSSRTTLGQRSTVQRRGLSARARRLQVLHGVGNQLDGRDRIRRQGRAQRPPNARGRRPRAESPASVFRAAACEQRCCVRRPMSSPPASSWA